MKMVIVLPALKVLDGMGRLVPIKALQKLLELQFKLKKERTQLELSYHQKWDKVLQDPEIRKCQYSQAKGMSKL